MHESAEREGRSTHATSPMWLLFAASSAASKCCWCDADTPKAAQSIQSSDGIEHELVFSDEFNAKGRDFSNGRDAKWTALEVGDTSKAPPKGETEMSRSPSPASKLQMPPSSMARLRSGVVSCGRLMRPGM